MGDPRAVLDMDDEDLREYLIVLELIDSGEWVAPRGPWPPTRPPENQAKPKNYSELHALACSYWESRNGAPHG